MIQPQHPKYRLLSRALSQQKNQKAYMKTLQLDVEKSKVAVENITTFTFTEQQLKKKIDDIQSQLKSCVTKIHSQFKKQVKELAIQKILTELIGLLKGQMLKYQTTQKKEEEIDNANHEKLVKKINYDIEQILQKHNEEIARISLLKEEASSRRSQRVVYSNLFKKLEKEIKYYEEIYKEQLMKTETAKLKGPDEQIKLPQMTAKPTNYEKDKKRILQALVSRNNDVRSSSNYQQPSEYRNPFITTKDECQIISLNESKAIFRKESNQNEKLLSDWKPKEDRTPQNKQIMKDITEYINFFEKIKIYTECSSAKEIIDHFSSLQQQSEELAFEIERCNSSIAECLDEKERICKKIHQDQFAYRYTICHGEKMPTKQFIQKEKESQQKQENIKNMLGIVESIGQLFDFELTHHPDELKLPNENQLQILDQKIDLLMEKPGYMQNRMKDDTAVSEAIVDCLLERMDKFNESERILDKDMFKQQYYKEINKGKRVGYRGKK